MGKNELFIINRGDLEYPKVLERLSNPPERLFCRGNLELLLRPIIAIVGTRDCTRYGVEVAKRFARAFADAGFAVISGLADGIDTAAHVGAGCEKTIAVLGNGLDVYYPQGNRELQREIGEKGLVITEYASAVTGNKISFPLRNRIVAALSRAVIIVEADIKSGTMITKDWALDLGIDVFAVPGPITSYASRGTNDLIKKCECAIATGPEDVLEELFGLMGKSGGNDEKIDKPIVQQISFEQKQILDIIGRDEVHFDEIISAIKCPVGKLATLLTNMELAGLIKKLSSNFYASTIM